LSQLRKIIETQRIADGHAPCQIWCGDYNALTRNDWSSGEWADIAATRLLNAWEAPVSDVSTVMTSGTMRKQVSSRRRRSLSCPKRLPITTMGFTDCWSAAPVRYGPLGTSRFNTRVDYIYCSAQLMEIVDLIRCDHLETIPIISDHNAVLTELRLRSQLPEAHCIARLVNRN